MKTLQRFIVPSLMLALIAVGCGGTQKVVRSEAFELVDEWGAVRASWSASNDGVSLELNDIEERPRLQAVVNDDGSARIAVLDERGTPRASLLMNATGSSVALQDGNGTERVSLGLTEGWEGLAFRDGNQKARAVLYASPGGVGLGLMDEREELRISISTDADHNPSALLYDGGGVERLTLTVGVERGAALDLYGADGGRTAGLP